MSAALTLDGQDFTGLYTDLAYYTHTPPRGSDEPARITALACDNPRGPLLSWLAAHEGDTTQITASTRGIIITGTVHITGASRWEFTEDPTTEPIPE